MIQIKLIRETYILMFTDIFPVKREQIPSFAGSFGKPCEMIDADDIGMDIMPVFDFDAGFQLTDFLEDLLCSEDLVAASECLDSRIDFVECFDKNAHRIRIVDHPRFR